MTNVREKRKFAERTSGTFNPNFALGFVTRRRKLQRNALLERFVTQGLNITPAFFYTFLSLTQILQ